MKQFLKCLILVSFVAAALSQFNQAAPNTKSEAKPTTTHVAIAPTPPAAPVQAVAAAVPAPPEAPPEPPAPVHTVGCAQYLPLIQQYNWNVGIAAAIMQAESGCNPDAVSPPNRDGYRDHGLFQIHAEPIYDPAANVARAYQKYLSQGWAAWTVYNTGAYAKFL